jgi:aspartokinase
VVVQKFGGTSVADPQAIQRLIHIVRTARSRDGRGPAVVVSAMSGVTDALLGIASPPVPAASTMRCRGSSELRTRHLAAAKALAPKESKGALGGHIGSAVR